MFPGVTAHATPGSVVSVLDAGERDVVFTGDARKNRSELMSRAADMNYDAAASGASTESIWAFWSRRTGNILIPGRDLPMAQENGRPRYLGRREAAIRAWYGEDLNEAAVLSLLPDSAPVEREAAE